MDVRLPHEQRTRTDADSAAKSARAGTGEHAPRSSRRSRRRCRWKFPITDGPFTESKEMFGAFSSTQSPPADDG
jgi:hypothetical protein